MILKLLYFSYPGMTFVPYLLYPDLLCVCVSVCLQAWRASRIFWIRLSILGGVYSRTCHADSRESTF